MGTSWKITNGNKITFFILIQIFQWQSCEIFTSVANLETFIHLRHEFLGTLEKFVKEREAKFQELKVFLERNEPVRLVQEVEADCLRCNSTNVLLAAATVVNFARVRTKLRKILPWFADIKSQQNELHQYWQGIKSSLPTEEDIEGAANAIIRLQRTYKLDADSIMALRLQDSTLKIPLLLDEIYKLGRAAFLQQQMTLTDQWMSLALKKLENETESAKKSWEIDYWTDVRDHLAYAAFKMGDYKRSLDYTKEILQRDASNPKAKGNLQILKVKLKSKLKEEIESESEEQYFMQQEYESLCRGGNSKKERRERQRDQKYVCGYIDKEPVLILRPYKFEVISIDPEIRLFYGMASKYEMRVLQRLAFPNLKRAVVSDNKNNGLKTASYRISKSGWLPDDAHDVVRKIVKRMEAVTGLSAETAEDLQIANYGIGGHYEPHYDWSRNFELSEMQKFGHGNRIATALLYLNNVPMGGATVFTQAEVTIWPKEGTMAFWYNLDKKGDGKENTIHAACPVLLGSKWVANKWFHERGQEFRRRCEVQRSQ